MEYMVWFRLAGSSFPLNCHWQPVGPCLLDLSLSQGIVCRQIDAHCLRGKWRLSERVMALFRRAAAGAMAIDMVGCWYCWADCFPDIRLCSCARSTAAIIARFAWQIQISLAAWLKFLSQTKKVKCGLVSLWYIWNKGVGQLQKAQNRSPVFSQS